MSPYFASRARYILVSSVDVIRRLRISAADTVTGGRMAVGGGERRHRRGSHGNGLEKAAAPHARRRVGNLVVWSLGHLVLVSGDRAVSDTSAVYRPEFRNESTNATKSRTLC